jgi:hypothetical protein
MKWVYIGLAGLFMVPFAYAAAGLGAAILSAVVIVAGGYAGEYGLRKLK